MAISEAIRSASAADRLMRLVSAETAPSEADRADITTIGSRNFIY